MSIRGAFGIFYENDVFNNTTNARNALIKSGAFFDDRSICNGTNQINSFPGASAPVTSINGVSIASVCSLPLGQAAPYLIAIQQQYQAATKANSVAANSAFVGETLNASGVYAPVYHTPYAEQWNGGIQRELFKGAILIVDYVHNSTLKIGQEVDQNHVGAARFLNTAAAQNAIAATTSGFGCVGGSSSAAINCAIAAGATINDFAGNGLDSAAVLTGGPPATAGTTTPATGAAFAGANPLLGQGNFIVPIGRSGYDALQVVYRQVVAHPVPGIQSSNFQVSYNLSRIVTTATNGGQGGSDAFFSSVAADNDDPNRFFGRAGLDRTHQLSFGGSVILKYGPQIGLVGHFASATPSTLYLDDANAAGTTAGSIFLSDYTGDGTSGDIAQGTDAGSYMHGIKGKNLASYINNFNASKAGTLTPAGQAVVSAGLFTPAQLNAIGAVQPAIAQLPQAVGINNPAFRALDVNFSYPIRFNRLHEGLSIEPAVAMYNVANLSNFSNFTSTLLNVNSTGGPQNTVNGYIAGPNNYAVYNNNRVQRGSGTFDQGAPRTTEFQLKLNF